MSFKNTLIILTSNVGSSVIAKGGASVGFQLPTGADPEADKYSRVRSLVLEELKVGGGGVEGAGGCGAGGWGWGWGGGRRLVVGVGAGLLPGQRDCWEAPC